MGWYEIAAAGAAKDLWVDYTGPGAPQYGRWVTPGGLDVDAVLCERGPDALDVDIWWEESRDHRGMRLTDFLWQTTMSGFKLVSRAMLEVLMCQGAHPMVFDVDIRLRDGSPVEGYVGLLEETAEPAPVHSLWRGKRSHSLVVSDEVLAACRTAGLSGLSVEEVDGPYPADRPGFFDDED